MLGDVTRISGKVVMVGYHQGGMREIPLAYWNWMAFDIINAHFGEEATIMRGMRIGMRLLTSGRSSLADLVTHRVPDGTREARRVPEIGDYAGSIVGVRQCPQRPGLTCP